VFKIGWLDRGIDLFVAQNVTFRLGGSKNILIHWWLTKRGKKIGGWAEVDWLLKNFCSMRSFNTVGAAFDSG